MRPELLAPAGGAESLTAALRCGADAVYAGASQFSARANAENFGSEALREAADLCHLYGAKLYLAVNTLLFDGELPDLIRLAETMAEIGADGAIVQDLGAAALLHRAVPTLPLHASTQLTVHTPAGIRLAKQAGFCRAVLARELSKAQIAALCKAARDEGMETEVFVHGAHCMCVSGQCYLSAAMGGRSANRGCCAQPCRLPFTADASQPEYCALSLKDMSLAEHLGELCELGVDSLKIEGRMKRPEYVAAAVTACKAVLDGAQPDLAALRAVFSRSGFTDGYFTGKRQNMFGTRQKEDVLAANTVLQSLRERYKKPRKCDTLDAHYVLRAGEPASLTVTDRAGDTVTVHGDIPQTAANRPAELSALEKQFAKLGDTVYDAGTVTAELGDNLMLPASALNALRRAAVSAMDTKRIAKHKPPHTFCAAETIAPSVRETTAPLRFRLQIRRLEQLAEIADLAEALDALLLPLNLLSAYQKAPFLPPERTYLMPPRFINNEAEIARMLDDAFARGYRHLAANQAGDIALGKEHGFTVHGTLGVHLTNHAAAEKLSQFGIADALCSPECRKIPAAPFPAGVYAYGRLPLMLTRNCPVQAQVGCKACRHHLSD
ncbi:MAG: U32 family peptidase, partial [Oscillospiraceae bacterium]|nr:U32 family peptidase [Oscillospiraceae bacterium]